MAATNRTPYYEAVTEASKARDKAIREAKKTCNDAVSVHRAVYSDARKQALEVIVSARTNRNVAWDAETETFTEATAAANDAFGKRLAELDEEYGG